jgi:integrase
MQIAFETKSSQETQRSSSQFDSRIEDSRMSMVAFIEARFIPNHVEHKTAAGRTHYHSILKHVLKPETVDQLLAPYLGPVNARLRSIPDWPYLDDIRICDLSAEHVRLLTSSALAHGYSPQTVKHIRSVVSAIVSHARREGVFNGYNPISEVELPPAVPKGSPNVTIVQAKAIIQAMKYPEREIALMTITVGMSVSEICGLQWKFVNFTSGCVFHDETVIPPRCILVKRRMSQAGLVDVNPNRVRAVEVPEPLFRRLLILRQEQRRSDPDCFVISSGSDAPLSTRMLRLKPIGQTLGMPWLSWQVLKRAHEALLSELRIQLSHDLVLSAR